MLRCLVGVEVQQLRRLGEHAVKSMDDVGLVLVKGDRLVLCF